MRTSLILAAFGASAFASETINERNIHYPANILDKRQQFAPSTQMATGDSCAAAFGSGYITCREKTSTTNRLCYNPDIKQSCCQSNWACPRGSECLPDEGQCCPSGSCDSATRIVVEGNITSTITASRTSTATGVVSVTGFRNSTATTTKATNTGSTPKSTSSSALAAAATPIAGTLFGLMGLAAAML